MMGWIRFVTKKPIEPAHIDVEIVELLARVRGALGWNVTPDGAVHVKYDATRLNERTLAAALRGLGFERAPAPVPVRAHYTYPIKQTGRSRR